MKKQNTPDIEQRFERLQRVQRTIETLRSEGRACEHVHVRENGYSIDQLSAGLQATCAFAGVCRYQYRLEERKLQTTLDVSAFV